MPGAAATRVHAWLLAVVTGLTALAAVLWDNRAEVLRPRLGIPAFANKGVQVPTVARRAWPWSPLGTTEARHLPPPAHRPLQVVHVADFPSLASRDLMTQFVTEMQLLGPDLILATGDISYVETQPWYDFLMQSLRETGIPVVAVAGNHERKDWPLWLRNFGSLNNHRVDFGPLAILSVDTVHGRDALTPSQFAWLRGEVRAARRKGLSVVIQAHHPIFPAGTEGKGEGHGSGGNLQIHQKHLVDLCRAEGVAAVLSGHWHQDAVFDLEGRFRDDTPDFPGTKFITTTNLGDAARLVTRWPHRNQGYRVLTFGPDGTLLRYTQDPEGKGRSMPVWSQPLGRIQVLDEGARLTVRNQTDLHLKGRLKAKGFDFPVDIPPGTTKAYPEEVR